MATKNAVKETESRLETRPFDTQTDKIFQLMIHSLYESREIFLRELISNASDACDKLRYRTLSEPGLMQKDAAFRIDVIIDRNKKTLTVSDNGVGMNREELIQNLGTIARSGTQNFMENLSGDQKRDSQLIGQFGVGFYSAFMVADRVEVISQAAGDDKAWRWESRGDGTYAVGAAREKRNEQGTTVTLHLKGDALEFLDAHRVRHILSTYSSHVGFPIVLKTAAGEERVNEGKALWRKPKQEVSEADYQEFYRNISYLGNDTPWMVLHSQVEGAVEYSSLLFIPTAKPFDLFHPDRQTRVKLYIKRVFIAETGIELIPPYLRFLRGVVDSQDLPLNISRETIQNTKTLRKIKDSITRKVLGELKKKAESEPQSYETFWRNFGQVVKEGLCDAMEPREQILEACRFYSLESADKLLSLDDYVSRMKDKQETIFYLTGEDVESAARSPQLEGFKRRGIDVLLLTDAVDEFWVNVVPQYKGKRLQSVTRGGYDLEEIAPLNRKKKKSVEQAEKEDKNQRGGEVKKVISFVKEVLGDAVKEVRTTTRLADSPVCLTVPEGAMDIRLERFMVENKQLPGASAKILEINPDHPIIRHIARHAESEAKRDQLKDTVELLFAQANIAEGEPVKDVAGFTRRLNALIVDALK